MPQTRANTYRCEICGGGIALHNENGGPYGCPFSREQVADDLGLSPEQAEKGWDDGLCAARAPGSGDPCVKLDHPDEPDNHDGRHWLYRDGTYIGSEDGKEEHPPWCKCSRMCGGDQ